MVTHLYTTRNLTFLTHPIKTQTNHTNSRVYTELGINNPVIKKIQGVQEFLRICHTLYIHTASLTLYNMNIEHPILNAPFEEKIISNRFYSIRKSIVLKINNILVT